MKAMISINEDCLNEYIDKRLEMFNLIPKPGGVKCNHVSQTPDSKCRIHMCVKCMEEYVVDCKHKASAENVVHTYQGYMMYTCAHCGELFK